MDMIENASLKPFNTFGIDVLADRLWTVTEIEDLNTLRAEGVFERKHLIIGGGSNLLLTEDFKGDVVLIAINGIYKLNNSEPSKVDVIFSAGEMWHECVIWAIDQGFGGIENMSLIPGTMGAAPMQNIGAYGVEIKDVFKYLNAYNKKTGFEQGFTKEQCAFGYRESVFKNVLKNDYIITSVCLELTTSNHKFNTSYGAISGVLAEKGIVNPTIKDISTAVIAIRQSKLPDPKEIGNSGSFFKNPIVEQELVERLKSTYPDIPNYPAGEGKAKLAAGWLIEQCGWKGTRVGETGSHAKQALVLVNYGNAKGLDIWNLALEIKASVKAKFGVDIEPEVNVV